MVVGDLQQLDRDVLPVRRRVQRALDSVRVAESNEVHIGWKSMLIKHRIYFDFDSQRQS